MAFSPRARVLLLAASILLGLTALVWYLNTKTRPATPVTPINTPAATSELSNPANNASSTAASASPSVAPTTTHAPAPDVSPSTEAAPSSSNGATNTSSPTTPSGLPAQASPAAPVASGAHATSPANAGDLLIPVAGVRPEQLQDTYTQSRSAGRTHNSIDIIAARNTPVLAATDGQIIKLFNSERGGITLYQLGTDNRTVYYYAHLERYADGITENRFARRGEIIGYVGDSGNAGRDNCHLHFSIWLINDPKHFWDGENINPYPLLTKR
jgi:murein DD-endopeptidase MepM/ murein hydrolase activator NlpD